MEGVGVMGLPDLELDRGGFIEGDGLGEEGGPDCAFSVVVKLVLQTKSVWLASPPRQAQRGRNTLLESSSYLYEPQHQGALDKD